MEHAEHVRLIEKGITKKAGMWADLGSGDGAFTLALRDLAGSQVEIFSIDKDGRRLQSQAAAFDRLFPQTNIHFLQQDFTNRLHLPLLDGILMANSLHYVRAQVTFLSQIKPLLRPAGKLLVVEYNTDEGNYWVPYACSFATFITMVKKAGFIQPELIGTTPSQFLNEMYAVEAKNGA